MTDDLHSMFNLPSAPNSAMADSFYAERLNKIATAMLLKYDLMIGNRRFEMLEVEGYLKASFHQDPYCHGHPKQKKPGYWFFHHVAMSSGFREGSRKGVDITVGNFDDGNLGGMLIRAIREQSSQKLVEGPSLVVDTIINEFNHKSVKSFVSNQWENLPGLAHVSESGFYLVPKLKSEADPLVYSTPRVGLGVSNKKSDLHLKFVAKFYRFIIHPELLKKGRALTILAMLDNKLPEQVIAKANQCNIQRVKTYRNTYELARKDAESLLKKGLEKDILKGGAEWKLQALSAICKLYN